MDITIDQWLSVDKSPKFYREYVGLFKEYFPGIDWEVYEKLNKAAYYHYHSLLLLDDVLDNNSTTNLPIRDRLEGCSIRLLTGIFGWDSSFWNHWNSRNQKVYEALEVDKKLTGSKCVAFEEYRELADLKSAAGLLAIDCLSILDHSDNQELYQALVESHKCFSTAFQLYDDIKDFKEDWESDQFNWAVYQYKLVSKDCTDMELDFNQKSFYLNGIASKLLGHCVEQLEEAISILPSEIDSQWVRICSNMQNEMKQYRGHIDSYLKCLYKKQMHLNQRRSHFTLPDIGTVNDDSLKKAWGYVQQAFAKNWGDLPHWMWLSKKDGFASGDEVKKGQVFQIAMVWECLSSVIDVTNTQWRFILEKEWKHIRSLRSKRKDGAWAYFSDVPELADDIDDLAQVIQVLLLLKKEDEIEMYCSPAIELIFEQRSIREGVWETWIVPVRNRNSLEQKQEWLNTCLWGRGPDIEVVANFAYALYSWKALEYSATVKRSTEFLIANQMPEGYWSSRWYVGHLYGTYQCLRLIQLITPHESTVLRKALDFTLSMQNPDGGFSKTKKQPSDPLSTAFALLILRVLGFESKEVLSKAREYLSANQNKDGSWEPVAFILAKPGSVYKSSVMTTAWVIRALNATEGYAFPVES